MNNTCRTILKYAFITSLAFAMTAHAQPAGPPSPDMKAAHRDMKAAHEAMRAQQMEDMKIILRLRPDQEPALATFMAADGSGLMDMHAPDEMHGPPKALSTPERLAEMARRDAALSTSRDANRQALAKFYGVLSADQQKVFDAAMRLQGRSHAGHDGLGPKIERKIIMRVGPGGPKPPHGAPH